MVNPMNDIPLIEQVEQARLDYLSAANAAAAITTEYGELKARVGGNETERKAAAKRTTPEEYDGWLLQFAAIDAARTDAVAYRDRCEKNLNTLRDMLNRETIDVQRVTTDRRLEAAQVERDTANVLYVAADVKAAREDTRRTMLTISHHPQGAVVTCGDDVDGCPF